MGSWSEISKECETTKPEGHLGSFDVVRRKYLKKVSDITGRNVILYATKFTSSDRALGDSVSIIMGDLHGFMEVVYGMPQDSEIDIILHSPGGSLEATEAIVTYLRAKFKKIRAIVPLLAQSAATMLACACNSIMMGKHSFLGPTDPQILLQMPGGARFVPAQAITSQFDRAVRECIDPSKLPAWAPMLSQYGPYLLSVCENATELSQTLVGEWLFKYMFEGDSSKEQLAKDIANWLSDHSQFMTHGRPLEMNLLSSKGLNIEVLEDDQNLQDAVLSLLHATTLSFEGTSAVKIIENNIGKAHVQHSHILMASQPAPEPPKNELDKDENKTTNQLAKALQRKRSKQKRH